MKQSLAKIADKSAVNFGFQAEVEEEAAKAGRGGRGGRGGRD